MGIPHESSHTEVKKLSLYDQVIAKEKTVSFLRVPNFMLYTFTTKEANVYSALRTIRNNKLRNKHNPILEADSEFVVSMPELEDRTGISKSTLRGIINTLSDKKLITENHTSTEKIFSINDDVFYQLESEWKSEVEEKKIKKNGNKRVKLRNKPSKDTTVDNTSKVSESAVNTTKNAVQIELPEPLPEIINIVEPGIIETPLPSEINNISPENTSFPVMVSKTEFEANETSTGIEIDDEVMSLVLEYSEKELLAQIRIEEEDYFKKPTHTLHFLQSKLYLQLKENRYISESEVNEFLKVSGEPDHYDLYEVLDMPELKKFMQKHNLVIAGHENMNEDKLRKSVRACNINLE